MQALRNFWSERAPRERAWLTAAGAVLGAAVFYLVAVEPAWLGSHRLERSLPATRAADAELKSLLAEARSLRDKPAAAVSGGDPRALIEGSAQRAGFKPTRIAAGAEGEWVASFANVPFAAWSGWLTELERSSGLRVIAVKAKAAPTPGQVDLELSLRARRN